MPKGYPTGKSLGFVKGDWVRTSMGWAGRILSDVHTYAPVCMVWGEYAEAGSVYAYELRKITKEQAIELATAMGHKIEPRYLADTLK